VALPQTARDRIRVRFAIRKTPAPHLGSAGLLLFSGWPNRVELSDEFIRIALGFALCCKRIERFVSHLPILVNIPAEAIGIPDIFYIVGHK
jgi:hypothetical protein